MGRNFPGKKYSKCKFIKVGLSSAVCGRGEDGLLCIGVKAGGHQWAGKDQGGLADHGEEIKFYSK